MRCCESKLESILNDLKDAHKEQNLEKIDQLSQTLNDKFSKISTEIYSKAGQENSSDPTVEDTFAEEVK